MNKGFLSLMCMVALDVSPASAQKGEPKRPPNIIVILADDLGYNDLGCYGGKIPTPNADRLAKEGRRFTDAHTPTGVCSPTRYGLLTGQYPWRTKMGIGIVRHDAPLAIATDRMTIASLLRRLGYATAAFGKWHLGLGTGKTDWNGDLKPGPLEVGFDTYFGIPTSHNWGPFVWVEDHKIVGAPKDAVIQKDSRFPPPVGRVDADVGLVLADKVDAFIEKNRDRPFFVYYPTPQVHAPFTPNAKFVGKSNGHGPHGDWVVEWDWCVGRVLATLDRLKIVDKTLLIVTSDNGGVGKNSSGPLRGKKATFYEGGHRVPYLVRWPGHVPAGTTCDETICHTDLLATFAALHGVPLPKKAGEDSYDILPAFRGAKLSTPIREASVYLRSTVRQGPWILIEAKVSNSNVAELYNLTEDLGQKNNVAAANPQIVERLTELLRTYDRRGYSRPMP